MDTAKDWASTFRKKTTRKKIEVAIWSPQLIHVSWNWKDKGGKHRRQQVKGLGKSWWKVARYTSKVTGLGTARAALKEHPRDQVLVMSGGVIPSQFYLYVVINRSVM